MRARRVAALVGIGAAVVAVLLLVALLVLTQTDWGRERVRNVALDRLEGAIDGEIEIGRVEGDLLSQIRLIDVSIRDRQGRPFLQADTLETRFGLRALLRQRIELVDTRLAGAVVTLDEPPGEDWNYVRIFRIEPDTGPPGPPGWGDWVALDDATLVRSRVIVRTAWHPPEGLTPAERERALQRALNGEGRELVVEVPGGYQNIMDFRELNAELPRVLVAHPDTAGIPFEVASLSGLVQPFAPPPAPVHDLSGQFLIVNDSLFMSGVRATLPDSRLSGGGVYALHSGDLLLIAHGHPVAFPDIRWLYPALPERGGGRMQLTLELGSVVDRIITRNMDVAVGDARVAGRLDLTTGDTLRFGETDLTFARVGTGLVERLFEFDFPRTGEFTGDLALTGLPRALRVDADIRFDDVAGPASRVIAEGGLGLEPDVRFRELSLRFSPLQAELARVVIPRLPVRGTIEGTALLTGTPDALTLVADLDLRDPRHGLSRVELAGGLDTRQELRLDDMVVAMDPLRLDLLRDEVPELPAGATATGRVTLDGVPTGTLRVAGDIVLDDPATGVSEIGARGTIAFGEEPSFRGLDLRFSPLQADLARLVIPELPVRGTIEGDARLNGTIAMLDLEADLALRDPRHGLSNVRLVGGLDRRDELRLRDMVIGMDPLRLDLLRDEVPELPAGAAATGRVTLDGVPSRALHVAGDIVLDDPATGISRIGATGRLAFADDLRFDGLRVRVDPLRVDLVRPWVPELPAGGTLVGAVRLDGDPDDLLNVDGQLAHRHPEMGLSRVQASGGLRFGRPFQFRGLDVRLEPLHMALVRPFAPELPLGGTLTGTAALNGSFESRIAVRGDLLHEEGGERSHVVGSADVVTGPGGYASVDVRLQPLSLDVAGRFVAGAGLRGSVAGRLEASGDLADLRVDTDLRTADGGTISGGGWLDLASDAPGYDLDLRLRDFDLASVTWRAPAETDLTGTLSADGRGIDPATMRATIAADLADSEIDDVGADLVHLRAELEAGLARLDSSVIRVGGAEALLDGSFGLIAGREGVLAYSVVIDSLHAFAPWLPGADTAVAPLPPAAAPAGEVVAVAAPDPAPETFDAADSDAPDATAPERAAPRVAAASEPADRRFIAADGALVTVSTTRVQTTIEREEDGERTPALARMDPDSLRLDPDRPERLAAAADTARVQRDTAMAPRAPADSLAGSLVASGTLRGNVERFDVDGHAEVDELLYRGVYIGSGEADYALADVGTSAPDIALDAEAQDVRTAGMAFDSLDARGRYRGSRAEGNGEAVIVAHGVDDREYRADMEFDLSVARSELRIADLMVRLDTVTWRTRQPGVVSWAADAIDVANVDLVSNVGGRVRVDGALPVEGGGDLDVLVEDLEIGQLVGLLQLDDDTRGRLDLDARVQGSLASPRITGDARLEDARLNGERLPDIRASLDYAAQELTVDATLLHDGRELAVAEARLPVDLSLTPRFAPRLLPGELTVDARADSLPVEAIPGLSEQLEDARGRVRGEVAVWGTVDDPVVTGEVLLDLASVRLVPLDVRLEEVAGSLVLDGDVMRIDSLVAHAGGPLRVTGEVGLETLTDPSFDLDVEARETLVINTEDASLEVDADMAIGGTFAAIEVTGTVRTRSGVIEIPRLSEFGTTQVVSLHAPTAAGRIDPEFLDALIAPDESTPFLDRLHLDVTLQIDRDVWLRSTEANVEIYTPRDTGPLQIRRAGPESALGLEGTINTDRGEYEFMSRRFELTRGAVTFLGESEIDPILQVAAEHEVRLPGREAFAIRVLLGGTLRELEITLESTSQPPIAQTDLLAYLAFGRDAGSLLYRQGSEMSGQGGSAGELVGNVAGLASQQLGIVAFDVLVSEIESELIDELGVDVFRITPTDLPPDMFTGSYADLLRSTEIEVGRYVSSRLFVAGQFNTGLARPGVIVEYTTPWGVQWLTAWTPRWLAPEPTLTEQDPTSASILGSFLSREWRF